MTAWLPERKFHPLVLVPYIITLAWSLCMVAAPLSLPAGSVRDLSGSVGIVDNANQTTGMNPFARWVYETGDVNCHQKSSRSYFINSNEMPYCARDVGIFFGMAIGMDMSMVNGALIQMQFYITFMDMPSEQRMNILTMTDTNIPMFTH
jgi:uncharacterized membrane protein